MATLSILFFLLLTTTSSQPSSSHKVETFTYTNSGEFGPYVTEYDASYRVLPLATSPFQLAFYNTTPNQFYLALRMGTLRSESLLRWVWEANRGRPVGEGATFSLRPDGDLVLAEADGRVVWSTGTDGKGVAGLELAGNGNLILRGRGGGVVWESFRHPTDTLLVGQSLGAGVSGTNRLVSRRSAVDGSFGIYTLEVQPGGITMYINNIRPNPIPYYNYSDGILAFNSNINSFTFNCQPETEDAFAYECTLSLPSSGTMILSRPKYNATLSILRLSIDGNLEVYTYYDPVDYRAWERTFSLFSDDIGRLTECALPSKCGSFGVCEDAMCVACPTPRGLLGWSERCEMPRLGKLCKGEGYNGSYYKVVGVDNFLTSYSRGEGGVEVSECKRRCSLDCGCVGVLYWEKERRCWLAPLLGTLSKGSGSSHVAYVKYLR